MNLANLITSSRLLVTLGVVVCLEMISDVKHPEPVLIWTAFGLFMYAACSDFVDGWVARRYGQETQLGRVIDPFADKFLICGAMISMLQFSEHHLNYELGEGFFVNSLQSWMVVLIVSREFLVTTIRSVAEAQGIKFPADRLGKLKMVVQCTAVSAQLTMIAGTSTFAWFGFWGIWVAIILSVVSAIGYVIKAGPILRGK